MSQEITATVTLPISDEVCKDLLTTAVEGGSTYWLACKTFKRDADLNVTKIIGCYDLEDPAEKWGNADWNTMRLGIQRLLAPGANVAAYIKEAVIELLVDHESSNWDAETADAVLQFGLLGELVYG